MKPLLGFAEDANVSPVTPMGLLAVFVVVNSVCGWTTSGGLGEGGGDALWAPTAEPQRPGDNGHTGWL